MISNIISGLSLLLSTSLAIFYLYDRRHKKFLLVNDYTNNLLKWHFDVTSILKKLNIATRDKVAEGYQQDLARLSTLIEQGRFYFPNLDRGDGHGENKPTAYRGHRNLALDLLVSAYNIFEDCNRQESLEEAKVIQKYFTSIVFEIVNPEARLETIHQLTDKYFIQEKPYDELMRLNEREMIECVWRE